MSVYYLILYEWCIVIWTWSLYNILTFFSVHSINYIDMIQWLHTNLKEKRDSLVSRLHKLQPTLKSTTVKEMSCFLSFRKSPSTMRKRRSSELHVAEQEPCNTGRRNFFLCYCKWLWIINSRAEQYKVIIGPSTGWSRS